MSTFDKLLNQLRDEMVQEQQQGQRTYCVLPPGIVERSTEPPDTKLLYDPEGSCIKCLTPFAGEYFAAYGDRFGRTGQAAVRYQSERVAEVFGQAIVSPAHLVVTCSRCGFTGKYAPVDEASPE